MSTSKLKGCTKEEWNHSGWSTLCCARFKGKFHIIINKIFFSTIIFNPNACMNIDLFFKIYIYSYTWPEGPLCFAWTNRESELSAWEMRNWIRVLLYLQSIEGMWIYIQNLWVKKFYSAGFDLTNDQLTNTGFSIDF